jgi:teichoic acid transport system permease protein
VADLVTIGATLPVSTGPWDESDASPEVDSVIPMSVSIGSSELPELRDAHEAAKLGPYLRDVWSRRSYIRQVSVSELRKRQVTNVLGNLWHLLNPALTIGVYYLVFGVIVQTDRGVDNFLVFLTIGLFVFQFGQSSTIDGARSVVSNKGLIKAVRFPRVILPLTSTFTEALATIPPFIVAYVVAIIAGVDITWRWPMLIPLMVVMTVFNAGTAMVAARLTTHFNDTTQILPFVFRLLLYVSGVIFSVDAYVADNTLLNTLFTLNPYYCFISLARWSILAGNLQTDLLVSAMIWTIAIFVGGFAWFRNAEEAYARD